MFEVKQFEEHFYYLKDFNWTGVILVCPPGKIFSAEVIELSKGFRFGSVWAILEAETSRLIGAGADHGDCDFPEPKSGERLCLATAEDLTLSPRLLEAVAAAWTDGEVAGDFTESQIAQGKHFQSYLRAADLESFALDRDRAPEM